MSTPWRCAYCGRLTLVCKGTCGAVEVETDVVLGRSYIIQAEAAARWFEEQRDDHTYLCASRLGGVWFDTCTCWEMPDG